MVDGAEWSGCSIADNSATTGVADFTRAHTMDVARLDEPGVCDPDTLSPRRYGNRDPRWRLMARSSCSTSGERVCSRPMSREQDNAAIRQIGVDCDDAWGRQDSVAFERQFAEDADFTSIGGIRCQGQDEIAAVCPSGS